VLENWQEEAGEHDEGERTMESKPTGQKTHLILVPGTKKITQLQALYLSPWLACLLSRCTQAGRGRLKRRTPHGNAQRVNPALRPWVCNVLRLGESKRQEMEGSQRHTAAEGAIAWSESMGVERGRWPELDRKSHASQSGNPDVMP
jgi:hypothetical protein